VTTIIRRADLGSRQLIKSGGFGDVYRLDRFRLAGSRQPMAYKEYTSEQSMQARAARMAVDLRDGLSNDDRKALDRLSVWPQVLVEDSGRVCGVLMPLLPDAFFTPLTDPQSGRPESKPRDLAWLPASESQRRAAGVDVPDVEMTDRLVLLAQLAYVVAWLHRRGWVYGDLNLHNVVFALSPARIKLLDCDSSAPSATPGAGRVISRPGSPRSARPPADRPSCRTPRPTCTSWDWPSFAVWFPARTPAPGDRPGNSGACWTRPVSI
jgi:hypothetical protein